MNTQNRSVALVAVLLAMFLAAMEATVVATAMPTVVAELGGLELYGWIAAVYTLASVVSMPLAGKLADSLGRRPAMIAGLFVFLAGSAASGFAKSMTALVVFRAVQGIGAGAIQPVSLTIVGDLYSPEERGRIQGVFGALWGVAGVAGPLLGALLVRVASWRWVFFVNVPAGLLSTFLFLSAFRESVPRRSAKIDYLGAIFLAASIVLLLLASSRVSPFWTAPSAALTLLAFLSVERRAVAPIVPLSLYRQRVIATASLASILLGGAMTGTLLFLPLYAQGVRSLSAAAAGLLITPMLVGWPIAGTASSRLLPRLGYRPLVRSGCALLAVGSLALAATADPHVLEFLRDHVPEARLVERVALFVAMFAIGLGMGFANTALLIAVQASVPWEQRGVATAGAMFSRSIGGALTAGVLGTVLAASLGPDVSPSLVNDLLGPEHGRRLDADVLRPLEHALSEGLTRVFWVVAGLGVTGFAAALLFPALRLERPAVPENEQAAPS